MTIAEGVMAGASLLGGVLGSRGSSKAAKAQTNIAAAQQRLEDAQYQQSRADTMPWMTAGKQALNQLSAMTQPGFDYRQLEQDPGYQFRRAQGENALSRAMAARGMQNSGAALKEAMRLNQGMASDEFTNAYNRLAGLAGTGQTAAGNLASLGSQYMQSAGNNAGQMANARASAYAGRAQAQQNVLADILGMVGSGAFGGLFGGKSIGNSGGGLKEKL